MSAVILFPARMCENADIHVNPVDLNSRKEEEHTVSVLILLHLRPADDDKALTL